MAEKVQVEVTGKSKYEVAQQMARTILVDIEGKQSKDMTRQVYLRAVSECLTVLDGGWPYD